MIVEFLVRRLLQMVPLLIGISVLGFAMMHLAPGGPTALYTMNPNVTAEDVARIKSNRSLPPGPRSAIPHTSWRCTCNAVAPAVEPGKRITW